MKNKCIGVDVGGTTVKLGLFEVSGECLKKWEIPTRKGENGKRIFEDVAAAIRETLTEWNATLTDVTGVGMGIPGPVMNDGYVPKCPNLACKELYPAKELSALLDGIPVSCGNDANVAALGEMWMGGGKGYHDIVMVTLGTGVGGGIILDEKIVTGRHGLGGEIGHIHVRDQEKEHCGCGACGCLEQVASATGIVREAKRVLAAEEKASAMREFGEQLSAKNVLDAAKAGDEVACEVMETVFHYLGSALASVSLTVDPEMFVIGGGVAKAGQFLIDGIAAHYSRYMTISASHAGICLAALGNDAGIYGAARLAL